MLSYHFFSKTTILGISKLFDAVCESTIKILKIKEDIWFDVNIVGTKQIHLINKKYRRIDKPTDVITFAYRDNNLIKVPLLGEILICLPIAKKQAKQYKHTLQRELIFLFTHGLLHLLGYDHLTSKDEKIMLALTDKIINNAEIPHKYIIR